ncbi:NAD-dependent protein deacetylase hst4 [Podospora conica]|nr:NAD-dependent protein deacetylase hst4 [Schizothecium conicum]
MDAVNRYPSPTTSASTSGACSPRKPSDITSVPTGEIRVGTDGPPRKRRKLATPPGPRTTTHVDLESDVYGDDGRFGKLLSALRKKKRIVVIAGAGISVSAGIPDFRSSTGLFTTLRGQHKLKGSGKNLFDASVYKHDDSTESFHNMVREMADMTSKASPTPFHHMLASLAAEGRLLRLYTQNIDTIDTRMPPLATTVPLNPKGPWPVTIQLHGGLEKMVCTKCGQLEPFNAAIFEGPEPPLCEKCTEQDEVRTAFAGKRSHGIGKLRPRIVLYNEHNPDEDAIGMVSQADLRRVPDAVIVVGTTLKIPGVQRLVREMCKLTRSRRDGITAWINIDPVPPKADFKDCWDYVVKGKCDDIAELVNLPRWDQQDIGDRESYMVTGDEIKEKRLLASLERGRIDVVLEQKQKRKREEEEETSGHLQDLPLRAADPAQSYIPTPSLSPDTRSPAPSIKPSTAGKTKQSTLSLFGAQGDAKPKAARKPAVRKPRQPKKAAAKPKNRLDQTFKTQKIAAPMSKQTPKRQIPLDPDSSDLSSPPDISTTFTSGLPALRPPTASQRPSPPFQVEKGPMPNSPPVGYPAWHGDTVSPTSKPRLMDHLIH